MEGPRHGPPRKTLPSRSAECKPIVPLTIGVCVFLGACCLFVANTGSIHNRRISRRTQDKPQVHRDPNTRRELLSESESEEGPLVEVSERLAPDGRTTLVCRAGGFSTPDITLVWLKDGEPRPQETRQEKVVPSADGTYETGATIDINPSPGDHYTCHVQHTSLPGGVHVDWKPASEPASQPKSKVLLISMVSVGVLLTGVAGSVCYLRKWRRRRRQAAEAFDWEPPDAQEGRAELSWEHEIEAAQLIEPPSQSAV